MITGLHVDVSSDELKTMLLGRLKYHKDKVALYQEQLVTMKSVDDKLKADRESIGKGSTQTPTDAIQSAIQKHENQCVYYDFMAKHVVASETYRLSEQDLQRLGVSSERFY